MSANPYQEELDRLPPASLATLRAAAPSAYVPYQRAEVERSSGPRRFTVVSTFSGGGGSSTGYRLAGGWVALANEFVKEAARCYRANCPSSTVDERDIREILKSEEATDNFLSQAGLKREDVDVLEGSPPCCEFSTAGKGISDQSKMRAYSDVRQKNIASLPFDFVDLALRIGPKVVICENVPAFATRARAIFESVLQSLRYGSGSGSRAYYVNCSVLSASSFGVPQRRRRLFIVGVRRDVAESVGIHDDDGVRAVFPAGSHTELSIRSAFTNLEQSPAHVWPWAELAMTSSLGPLIRKLPKSPARWTRLGHVMPNVRENFTLTRCSWDLPAPTLTVFGQAPNQMSGAIHPEQDRKFTIPELKRLFALPDDFILTGTLSQGAERICRMVPPPLTKAIAERVYERVLKPFKERS